MQLTHDLLPIDQIIYQPLLIERKIEYTFVQGMEEVGGKGCRNEYVTVVYISIPMISPIHIYGVCH